MNLYTCAIELRDDAKAISFSMALESWMTLLQERQAIRSWRLYRRKLGFGAPVARDFRLDIEVEDMTQLDAAFRLTATHDEDIERLYGAVHQMIGAVDIALYRPFPDPEKRERMALI